MYNVNIKKTVCLASHSQSSVNELVFQNFVPHHVAFNLLEVKLVAARCLVFVANLVIRRDHVLAIWTNEVALPFGVVLTRFAAIETD